MGGRAAAGMKGRARILPLPLLQAVFQEWLNFSQGPSSDQPLLGVPNLPQPYPSGHIIFVLHCAVQSTPCTELLCLKPKSGLTFPELTLISAGFLVLCVSNTWRAH